MATLVTCICKSTIPHLKAAIKVETAPTAIEASKGKAALAVTVAISAMEAMEAMVATAATTAMAVMVAVATGGAGVHVVSYVEIVVMSRWWIDWYSLFRRVFLLRTWVSWTIFLDLKRLTLLGA
jgi:hypothetical protein